MPRDATDTRERLLRSAEYLFARTGIDTPIREIHKHAGQRNASAIQYHFGSKQELLNAVIARGKRPDAEAAAIRADLRARRADPRCLVEAIVRRMAEYLQSDQKRDFVRIAFQLLMRSRLRSTLEQEVEQPDLITFETEIRIIRGAVPHLPRRVINERALAGLTFVAMEIAERARMIDDQPDEPVLDDEEFINNLVDMTTAMLTAPAVLQQTVA